MNGQGRSLPNEEFKSVSAADTDPLTNVYNRFYLNHILPRSITEAKESNTELCIFIIDVDDFKHINDTYGHLTGDEVLKDIARVIKKCVRDNDIVIRYAGDEFVVVSKGAGYNLASLIGNRIVDGVSKREFETKSGEKIHLSISAGSAVYPHDGHQPEELVGSADRALYLSKERGKNKLTAANEVTLGMITKKEMLKVFPCRTFINRETQFDKLKTKWQSSIFTKIPLVLIKGEGGIGKTRFLEEFDNFLTSRGAFCLKVECDNKHTVQPYYFISQAIGKTIERNEKLTSAIYLLSPEEVEALSVIIPELRNLLKSKIPASSDTAKEKSKELSINIFKGLRNLFIELSRQGGFFIYFDNIHWIDKATFELLNYFIEIERGRKILLTGAFDAEELKSMELPFVDFLSPARTSINFEIVELPPFNLDQVKELIANIFPGLNANNDFFESIYKISRGNPFFTEELLKHLIESENIIYKENRWQIEKLEKLDIPASLDDVMKRRIRGLDTETKEMLAQAALIGEDFKLEILRRLVEKNEGYLLELIDRAKQKFMIEEREIDRDFNFLNTYLRNVFYNEISPTQKNSLHNKAGNVFSELYTQNPNLASGEAVHHYRLADNKSKFAEYKQEVAQSASKLYDPEQLSKLIETLANESAIYEQQKPVEKQIKEMTTEIDEKTLASIASLIQYIFAAIRNVVLYPPQNRIRQESITRIVAQLKEIFKHASSLTFSEVERLLLVNGNRIPAKTEKENIEAFISQMIERDIKALQFLPQVTEEEINEFLKLFSKEADEVRKEGGIVALIKNKGIQNIRINVADYGQQVISQSWKAPAKEKLITMVLMDFLTGKTYPQDVDKSAILRALKNSPQAFAKDILEAANIMSTGSPQDITFKSKVIAENIRNLGAQILPGGWKENQQDLAKLLTSLNTQVRKEVVSIAQDSAEGGMGMIKEVVSKFSDAEIIEIITSGYSKEETTLLNMRELCHKLTADSERKTKIVPQLEQKLRDMGLEESEIAFVAQKEYTVQPMEERIDALYKLPLHLYKNIGMENIKSLIKDLIILPRKDNLNNLVMHFLKQIEEASPEGRAILLELLLFVISLFPCDTEEFDALLVAVNEVLVRRIDKEEVKDNLNIFLKIIQTEIDWMIAATKSFIAVKRWIMRNRFLYLNKLLAGLLNISAITADSEQKPHWVKERKSSIANFLSGLVRSEFIEVLINELKDPYLEYNKMIEDMIIQFGEPALKVLMASSLEEIHMAYSFEGYLYHRKINNVIKRMGEAAINELVGYLSKEQETKKVIVLLTLAAEMRSDKIVDAIRPLCHHADFNVRKEVVLVLSNIATAKSKLLLRQMKGDKDRRISRLVSEKLKGLT